MRRLTALALEGLMQSINHPNMLESAPGESAISTRWFLRRFALWMLFVTLGVSAACLLYTAAGTADTNGPQASLASRAAN